MTNSYWKLDFQKIVFDYSPGIQRFLSRGAFAFSNMRIKRCCIIKTRLDTTVGGGT
jgi:hypothetical protein